ncbi:hypothetical protein FOZ63_011024 [Perkinsus olseni]|uniref:protein-serine/threonine phosphatase n=1 Tax=Perkinsus olseni TaxID=32597 RepID=A0A7J6S7B7_PEROL|nr:hypothetical protein FOZ62_026481 [Perkinsus olseni]KAF4756843.1 hypothetical protein FOZ63_011024 [Perkinsus olseni]
MRRIFRNSVIWGQGSSEDNSAVEDDDDEGGPGVEADPISPLFTNKAGRWPKCLEELEEGQSMGSTSSGLIVSSTSSVNPIGFHDNEDRIMNYQETVKVKGLSQEAYIFGVLDGHDGTAACDLVAAEFPKRWVGNSVNGGKLDTSIVDAATAGLKHCEQALQTSNCSAGVCVLGNLLIGSRDMKATASYERRRISKAGGNVTDGRVAGVLEPSRTIGDFDVKMRIPPDVITVTPEVRCVDLLSTGRGDPEGLQDVGKYGAFGLMMSATDGIWDGCGRRAIRRAVNEYRSDLYAAMKVMYKGHGKDEGDGLERPRKTLQMIGKKMVSLARHAGSLDDCTCQVALVYAPPDSGVVDATAKD